GRPAHAPRSRRAPRRAGDRGPRPRRRRDVEWIAEPGTPLGAPRDPILPTVQVLTMNRPPLRVGIGGPVGSGKTALTLALCKAFRDRYEIAAVTNDIYTEEDAQFLVRNEALAPERILGVETGGCPHTAIREDASINLEAVARLNRAFPKLELILIESGGDNLA